MRFANGALGTLILADSTATPWNWEATARDSAITPTENENCFHVAGTKGSLAIPQLQHWCYDKADGAWADPLTRRYLQLRRFGELFSLTDEGKAIGQFGGGLEIRVTPHIGWMADFSWCVLDGPDNNFGMVRTGLNFSF